MPERNESYEEATERAREAPGEGIGWQEEVTEGSEATETEPARERPSEAQEKIRDD